MVGILTRMAAALGGSTAIATGPNPNNFGTENIPMPAGNTGLSAEAIYNIKFAHMSAHLANGGTRPRASTVRRALRLEAAGKSLKHGARIVLPDGTTKHPTKRR